MIIKIDRFHTKHLIWNLPTLLLLFFFFTVYCHPNVQHHHTIVWELFPKLLFCNIIDKTINEGIEEPHETRHGVCD